MEDFKQKGNKARSLKNGKGFEAAEITAVFLAAFMLCFCSETYILHGSTYAAIPSAIVFWLAAVMIIKEGKGDKLSDFCMCMLGICATMLTVLGFLSLMIFFGVH